jgi:hypothetical protein
MFNTKLESLAIFMMKTGNKIGLDDVTDHKNRIALSMLMNLKSRSSKESFALAANKVGICQNVFAEVMGTTIRDHYCENVVIGLKPHVLTIAQYENGLFYAIPINSNNGNVPLIRNPTDIDAERNPFPYDFDLPSLNPDKWEAPGYRKEEATRLPGGGVRSQTTDLKYLVGQNQITVLLESSDITSTNLNDNRNPEKSHHIRTAWLYCPEDEVKMLSAFQVYIQREKETWIYCFGEDNLLKLVSKNYDDEKGEIVFHKPNERELLAGFTSVQASSEMVDQMKEVFDSCYPRMFYDRIGMDATINRILRDNRPELRSYLD